MLPRRRIFLRFRWWTSSTWKKFDHDNFAWSLRKNLRVITNKLAQANQDSSNKNFKMSDFMKTGKQEYMNAKKKLKRRTNHKLNYEAELGCKLRQVDVINRNVRTFSNLPTACAGRSIIEIDDTKIRRAETIIFTPQRTSSVLWRVGRCTVEIRARFK